MNINYYKSLWTNHTQGSINMQYSKYWYLFQLYQNTLGIAMYLQNIQKYENVEFLPCENSGFLK